MSGSFPAAAADGAAVLHADAIVVAAGRSSRMDGTDKLAAELGGRPLLAWTLDAISAALEVERIVVVTALDRQAEVAGAGWLPERVVDVVAGGPRRQDSVHAGFVALDRFDPDERGVVLVHDGVSAFTIAMIAGPG